MLLHAALIQAHNTRVGLFDIDFPGLNECVHVLRLQYHVDVLVREYFLYDVLKNFLTLLMRYVLAPQSLIKNVNDLTTKVDDKVWIYMCDAVRFLFRTFETGPSPPFLL